MGRCHPELRKELLRLFDAGAEIHLVNCVDRTRPNLSLPALRPAEGIHAAGVTWLMEVGVQNFGPATARNVSVILGEDGHGRPAVTLSEIPPHKIATARFRVRFPDPGWHQITARLRERRGRGRQPSLLDDEPSARRAGVVGRRRRRSPRRPLLSWALAPGGTVRTGVRPQIETPRYLSLKPLDGFPAINLANIDRLDSTAVAALEKVRCRRRRRGVFPRRAVRDVKFFNDVLYRGGKGLFPVPLGPAGRTAGRSARAGPRPSSWRALHLPRLRRQPEHVPARR